MNELRRATRKTVIEDIKIKHVRRGDLTFPPDSIIEGGKTVNEAWAIWTTYRTGLQPSKVYFEYVLTEDEALLFKENYPIGKEITEPQPSEPKEKDIELIRTLMASGIPFGVCAGDGESPLAFDILGDAGINRERYGPISSEVAEFLGKERISELQENYGENWDVAAAFEFCWLNLPHSSPAFVAAASQYHYYITEDDFLAGYYWRDLEIMVHRVEEEALKAIETRQKAGKSGSKRSAQAREKRRADLIEMMEALAARNPDIVKFGADSVAKLASEECANDNPSLWTQGLGQVIEYLGEIQRGEAGPNMQERYKALFGSKPPKRFKGLG
ncbi:MAG: hypothetical protein IBX58_18095 [Roseovarius sp.]|nr:hypothetical protein [Roseovarius sp.]